MRIGIFVLRVLYVSVVLAAVGFATVDLRGQDTRNAPAMLERKDGLQIVSLDTINGRVIVNLPDDIRAGDTISGTVVAEPKGATAEEKARNKTRLEGYVLDLEGTKVKAGGPAFKWTTPLPQPRQPMRYQLRIVDVLPRTEAAITPYPAANVAPAPRASQPVSPAFFIPRLAQTGRPIVITGPFDGDSSNTRVSYRFCRTPDCSENPGWVQSPDLIIAESPRQAVCKLPADTTGPMEIRVIEGPTQTTGSSRNVKLDLSAPKTSLMKGERTTLTVHVTGLQGIKEPVPLTLESSGVITMEGGMYQPMTIQPSQVGADGRYVATRDVTGVQAGAWRSTATVVTRPFNVCVQDDKDQAKVVLLNTVTGDYVFFCPGCAAMGQANSGVKPVSAPALDWVNRCHDIWYGFGFHEARPGQGKVSINGSTLILAADDAGARFNVEIDWRTSSARATVDVPASKMRFTITDRNMADNMCPMR